MSRALVIGGPHHGQHFAIEYHRPGDHIRRHIPRPLGPPVMSIDPKTALEPAVAEYRLVRVHDELLWVPATVQDPVRFLIDIAATAPASEYVE